MKYNTDFGLIFWVHLFLILIAYISPLFFRWQLILVGVLLLFIQWFLFQGCVLTHAQFGKDKYMTFYYRYLTLMGINVDKKKLKFLMTWIMPLIVLFVAVILQYYQGYNPLIY
jgi:disulfide bond formation protein DsbB